MDYLKGFIKVPKAIKDQQEYKKFVDELSDFLENTPSSKRRVMLDDLIMYCVDCAELHFWGEKMGLVKKAAVLEALCKVVPDDGSLDDLVENALKYKNVVKKTKLLKFRIWLKKNVLQNLKQ